MAVRKAKAEPAPADLKPKKSRSKGKPDLKAVAPEPEAEQSADKASESLEIDPVALRMKEVRAQKAQLEKIEKGLRDDLLSRFKPGSHPGFIISEEYRELIDQDLLKTALGDLAPYKKLSKSIVIKFANSAS